MKKSLTFYSIVWAICLAIFNLAVFLSPSEAGGMTKFGGGFWAGYVCISVAFVGQLICAALTLSPTSLKKTFYRLPLVSVSYTGLIVMLIVGVICMAIPNLPIWIAVIVCAAVLALEAIALLKASAAVLLVESTDKTIAGKTFFVKSLTVDAEALLSSASSDALRAEAKRVYETIRSSDPMSAPALASIEGQIAGQFHAFADAVKQDDAELAEKLASTLVALVEQRNSKCKLLK